MAVHSEGSFGGGGSSDKSRWSAEEVEEEEDEGAEVRKRSNFSSEGCDDGSCTGCW